MRDADGFDEFYRGTRVRVLQFLYAACGDLGKFMQQLLVDNFVRGKHLAAGEFEWAAAHVGYHSTCLFDQQDRLR